MEFPMRFSSSPTAICPATPSFVVHRGLTFHSLLPNLCLISALASLALAEPQVTHTERRMPTHDVASRIEYSEKYQDDTHEYR